jgi:type IV pilus assembly protein PilB
MSETATIPTLRGGGGAGGLSGLPQRLVQDGVISEDDARRALAAAKDKRSHFVNQLIGAGSASARDIAVAASVEFGVPLFDLDSLALDLDTTRLVSEKLLAKHRVLPMFRRGKRLYLAVSDPTDLHAIDEIKFQTSMGVDAVVVEDDKLQKLVDKAIEGADSGAMPDYVDDDSMDLDGLEVTGGDDPEGDGVTRDDVEDAPIVRYVNKLLLEAIRKGASDVHFEPYEKTFRVRYRLDGILKEVAQPPVQLAGKLAARLKVMSRLDIAERRVPQDGRIKMRLSKTRAIDFRVSTCPTLFGEKICARILDPSSAQLGIDALGYEPVQKEAYLKALKEPQGMILVTGPTGSGKTVSLYTGVNILNTEDINISTAEDPAEINLPGVNQVNVNPKVGLTFAAALKAFLRQDPDVILVGEIRDLDTAEIALKAAQTGHLVLSTLHTNDAPQTIVRMMNMGIPAYNLASTLTLINAQRLARGLCKVCKRPANIPREELNKNGFTAEQLDAPTTKIMEAVGCDQCDNGYKGRTGIYQVMPFTEEMGRIIMEGGNALDVANQAQKEGIKDLRQSALIKVLAGKIDLAQANACTVAD